MNMSYKVNLCSGFSSLTTARQLIKNRYLRTVEEVNDFWDLITGIMQKSDLSRKWTIIHA
jgi:hypothetical protein